MEESLEISLFKSIESDNLIELGEKLKEPIKEILIEEGTLKDIPILGVLAKTYSVAKDIKNYLFLRKVYRFLFELKNISEKERKEFLEKLEESGKQIEFGESVLLLLEKADHLNKPYLIGNIIKALINEKIEYDLAMRLCSMINRAYYQDLVYMKENEAELDKEKIIADNLSSLGFLNIQKKDFEPGVNDTKHNEYVLNKFSKSLLKFAFNNS